jgi:adenosylcobalamin-dependent ribonucleoside-triphosphate reductase
VEFQGIRQYPFKLSDHFLDQFKGKQPKWGPLGYFIFKRTYARFLEDGSTEEFWQTLQRVVEGTFNIQKFHAKKHFIPWDDFQAQRDAKEMYQRMWDLKLLPSGRGLWLMGTDFMYKNGSAGLCSCAFTSTQDMDQYPTEPFVWAMEALLLGLGVGADVKGAGKAIVVTPVGEKTFVIPDSRQGWTESLRWLLKAFFKGKPMPVFDYSEIRPAGVRLKSFGGVASGPQPLVDMHDDMIKIFRQYINKPIDSTLIVDVFNLIGRCVVSGNIRRSALIMLGLYEDTKFLDLKQDVEKSASWRWASNNSVLGHTGASKEFYESIVRRNELNGEPGIIFLDNIRKWGRMIDPPDWLDRDADGVNPCGEQALEPFEACNLGETYPVNHEDYDDYQKTLQCALLYCKSVTLLDTPWPKTNAVMRKNRRLGISQSGIIEAMNKFGHATMRDWSDKGYKYLRKQDHILSKQLCVRESLKLTTCKPSGTNSLLPGVSPGIHYPHSEYYIRRVRVAVNSPLIVPLLDANYPIEKDVNQPNTMVVEFPVHTPNFRKGKSDITVWQQFENAAMYQRYWSDNQVSITVTFKDSEVDDLVEALQYFDDRIKAVSFLRLDTTFYTQPPYETITKVEFETRTSQIKKIDFSDVSHAGEGVQFCTNDTCELPTNGQNETPLQVEKVSL